MAAAKNKRVPKTRVQASVLRAALKDVSGIVEARNTVPILSNVLLSVVDQRVTITASDLDMWAVRGCATADRDGPSSREWLDSIRGFAVCLPHGTLAKVLGEIDDDAMVTIEAPAEITSSWAGRVTVSAGRARFKLPALPVAEFPLLPPFDGEGEFEMPCSQLSDVFAGVDHAISSEETRYYLNGIFLHPHDMDLRFVATDGHRLARWTMDGPVGSTSFPQIIVGRKAVAELEKLLSAAMKADKDNDGAPAVVTIEVHGLGARVRFLLPDGDGGEIEIQAKTIDGQFPDYTRVIPSAPAQRAIVDRAALSATVKRVAVIAAAKSRAVKLSFDDDRLTISTQSPELGEASEELDCTYSGPALDIGFDAKFLRDALGAAASDKVALSFDDAASPMRVCGWEDNAEVGALLQVVMPVRV